MKSWMKKTVCFLTALCITACLFTINTFAAGSTIAFSKSSLTTGEQLTVTVNLLADEAMYGAEAYLKYDSAILRFESGDASSSQSSGVVYMCPTPGGAKSVSVKLTFSAVGTGSTALEVYNAKYVGEVEQNLAGCSARVSVKSADAAVSGNADLKSIWISSGTLNPAFSPSVTSYNITIPYDKTVLTVSAETEDADANITVIGSKEMKVGTNKRVIQVTAANGTVKNYTLNITRLAEDGTASAVTPDDGQDNRADLLKVIAEGEVKYIAENFATDNLPDGYTLGSYDHNGTEVPAISDGEETLLYLTDEDGQNGSFYTVASDGSFTKFTYVKAGAATYVLLPVPDGRIPNGYSAVPIVIGEITVEAYQGSDPELSEFVLVYAKGPNEYTGFYRYDTTEKTFQRATGIPLDFSDPDAEEPTDILSNIRNLNTDGKIVAGTIVLVILLLIIAIIVLIVKIAASGRQDDADGETNEKQGTAAFDYVTVTDRDRNDK